MDERTSQIQRLENWGETTSRLGQSYAAVDVQEPNTACVAVQQPQLQYRAFAKPGAGDLMRRLVQGGAVTLVAQGLKFGLRMGTTMILARLLAPGDFGVQGMVLTVTGFLGLFRDAGLSLATVQRDAITHEQTSTLFWINVGMGVVLALLLWAVAPALAGFYREPRLQQVAMVSALAFLFNGLAVQHLALLQRNMRFVALAAIDIASLVTSALVGIAMAALGYGYWALVWTAVSMPMVTVLGAWLAVPWVPGMPRRNCGIRSMLNLGGTWTLIGFIVYVSYNVEKVLLGRFWGADSLGLYGRAYQLVNLPTELLNSSVGSVAVPALSRLQGDAERLHKIFLKCYALVLSVTIPVTLICALFAEEVIWVVLGPAWSEAALILRLLAPTVLAFAVMNPFSWLLMATARNRLSIVIALFVPPAVILGILAGLRHGPAGVALGYSAGVCLSALPVILLCRRASGIPLRELREVVERPLLAGLVAATCGLGLKIILQGVLPPALTLITELSVTLGLYAWVLLMVLGQRDFLMDILKATFQKSIPNESTAP